MGEDESEVAEFDYSTESDEQVPWENTQPFKPDENPFLAEPEKQKTEKKESSLTGGASSVNTEELPILEGYVSRNNISEDMRDFLREHFKPYNDYDRLLPIEKAQKLLSKHWMFLNIQSMIIKRYYLFLFLIRI